jgi:hypothetical protein
MDMGRLFRLSLLRLNRHLKAAGRFERVLEDENPVKAKKKSKDGNTLLLRKAECSQ